MMGFHILCDSSDSRTSLLPLEFTIILAHALTFYFYLLARIRLSSFQCFTMCLTSESSKLILSVTTYLSLEPNWSMASSKPWGFLKQRSPERAIKTSLKRRLFQMSFRICWMNQLYSLWPSWRKLKGFLQRIFRYELILGRGDRSLFIDSSRIANCSCGYGWHSRRDRLSQNQLWSVLNSSLLDIMMSTDMSRSRFKVVMLWVVFQSSRKVSIELYNNWFPDLRSSMCSLAINLWRLSTRIQSKSDLLAVYIVWVSLMISPLLLKAQRLRMPHSWTQVQLKKCFQLNLIIYFISLVTLLLCRLLPILKMSLSISIRCSLLCPNQDNLISTVRQNPELLGVYFQKNFTRKGNQSIEVKDSLLKMLKKLPELFSIISVIAFSMKTSTYQEGMRLQNLLQAFRSMEMQLMATTWLSKVCRLGRQTFSMKPLVALKNGNPFSQSTSKMYLKNLCPKKDSQDVNLCSARLTTLEYRDLSQAKTSDSYDKLLLDRFLFLSMISSSELTWSVWYCWINLSALSWSNMKGSDSFWLNFSLITHLSQLRYFMWTFLFFMLRSTCSGRRQPVSKNSSSDFYLYQPKFQSTVTLAFFLRSDLIRQDSKNWEYFLNKKSSENSSQFNIGQNFSKLVMLSSKNTSPIAQMSFCLAEERLRMRFTFQRVFQSTLTSSKIISRFLRAFKYPSLIFLSGERMNPMVSPRISTSFSGCRLFRGWSSKAVSYLDSLE